MSNNYHRAESLEDEAINRLAKTTNEKAAVDAEVLITARGFNAVKKAALATESTALGVRITALTSEIAILTV